MPAPAKSVLNSIKDLQGEVDQLRAELAALRAEGTETPGSSNDIVARLTSLEAIIWGTE